MRDINGALGPASFAASLGAGWLGLLAACAPGPPATTRACVLPTPSPARLPRPLHPAEATNNRVAWFNILAALICIGLAVWQLWYLNKVGRQLAWRCVAMGNKAGDGEGKGRGEGSRWPALAMKLLSVTCRPCWFACAAVLEAEEGALSWVDTANGSRFRGGGSPAASRPGLHGSPLPALMTRDPCFSLSLTHLLSLQLVSTFLHQRSMRMRHACKLQ